VVGAVVLLVITGSPLAGCSDIYFDRRETVALGADDAVAANQVTQMVDPWPQYSNNNNLTFNGERMQRAVECYRKNRVTQPTDLDASADTGLAPPPPNTACQGQMTFGSAPAATGAPPNPDANK
jgi:hypothetical protein